jgi:hypothetical protein
MTLFDDELAPPKPEPGDLEPARHVVETLAGLVPMGAGTLLLKQLVTWPFERRMEDWQDALGRKVRELSDQGKVDLNTLREDPQFTDAVLAATQAAMKTSRQEKLEALRNAVLHAALPTRPDETLQHQFIGLIDRFTTWHLAILKLIADPPAYIRAHNVPYVTSDYSSSLSGLIETAFPALKGRREMYDQIWADLYAAGLHRTPNLHTLMTGGGGVQPRASELGHAFLKFIEAPE